jgi:diguanylate cyclase (GGDEF)-like protein
MSQSVGAPKTDVAASARRPTSIRTLVLALALSSVIPLLVAGYGLHASRLAAPDSGGYSTARLLSLFGIAVASAASGAAITWSLVTRPRGGVEDPSPPSAAPAARATVEAGPGRDRAANRGEIESLMDSFSGVLTAIEHQAAEVNQYAVRLDNAYKEIETSSARLKEFSFKDEVTGLYNRRFFSIRLEEEVSRYRRFNHPASVVLLDLDGFKAVNDELGHAAGDETLRGVAEVLLKHSRGINVICRYGGDEFAILLVETAKAGAWLYADRIRDVLPAYRFSHGRPITASFGIAALPEDVAPSPEELIQAADEALYAAKRAGKNRVSVYGDTVPGRPAPSGDRSST